MKKLNKTISLVLLFIIVSMKIFAQAPDCSGADSSKIFIHSGSGINVFDPALPISPSNPTLWMNVPIPMGGLAIAYNLNAPTPTTTFYTNSGGNYSYYNGVGWTNTGHTVGFVNPGGGVNFIYTKNGGTGQIQKYDGTGPATFLTTVSANAGPYDLATDNQDNFYHLQTSTNPGYLIKYSPAGVAIDTVIVTGHPIQNAGGGFAMIGNNVYAVFNSNPSYYHGVIAGNQVVMMPIGNITASDLATCPSKPVTTIPPDPPIADFTTTSFTICAGSCIGFTDLTQNSPSSWTWTFPGGIPASSILQNPNNICFNTPGVYDIKLVVSNVSGIDSITKVLTVLPVPIASITGDDHICEGETSTLTASPAGMNYVWSTGALNQIVNVSPTTTTTFTVIVNQAICADTATFTVLVDPTPHATIVGDMDICAGESTTLTTNPAGLNYQWSTGANTQDITVNPINTTTYAVTVTAGVCTETHMATVNVHPIPSVKTTPNRKACDKDNGTITTDVFNSNPPYQYAWSNGQSNATADNLALGTYTVTVTDANGCSNTSSAEIIQADNPIVQITPVNAEIVEGESVRLTANGAVFYQWFPTSYLNCVNCQTVLAEPPYTMEYCVEGKDGNGCVDTSCVWIIVDTNCKDIFIPTAFSPNKDGLNDFFYIKGRCVQKYQMNIYNRWGTLIFSTSNGPNKWDGTYKGVPCDIDTYFYQAEIELLNHKKVHRKGDVILTR